MKKKLLTRYKNENNVVVSKVVLIFWDSESDILVCAKGVYVFLELSTEDVMYEKFCELLQEVS